MTKIFKTAVFSFMISVLLSVCVYAGKPNLPDSITVMMRAVNNIDKDKGTINVTGYEEYSKYIGRNMTISDVSSSNKSVLIAKELNGKNTDGSTYCSVSCMPLKPGMSTVTFTVKEGSDQYNYKIDFIVVKPANPVKSLKIGGTEYAGAFDNNHDAFLPAGTKGEFNLIPNDGWKAFGVYLWEGGQNTLIDKADILNGNTISINSGDILQLSMNHEEFGYYNCYFYTVNTNTNTSTSTTPTPTPSPSTVTPTPTSNNRTKGNIYGLIIGTHTRLIDKVRGMSGQNDSLKMYNALNRNKLKNYKIKKMIRKTYKKSPTKAAITNQIKNAFQKAEKNDLCFFAYAGHGAGYLKEKKEIGTGIDNFKYTDLLETLHKNCKGHIVMMISTCYSGGFSKAIQKMGHCSDKFTIITSSGKNQGMGNINLSSIESQSILDLKIGILAYYISEGLGNKKADSNRDKKITAGELANYTEIMIKTKHNLKPVNWIPDPDLVIYQ